MKKIIVLFFVVLLISKPSFSQINFNSPSQFGNNNTQNNYLQPKLKEEDKIGLTNFINTIENDSSFHSIKYYEMTFASGSNGMQVLLDISSFLKSKGYLDKGNGGYNTSFYSQMPMGVIVGLSKKDSTLNIIVGQLVPH